MVKTLIQVIARAVAVAIGVLRVPTLELAGAALVVWGVWEASPWVAKIVGGVFVLGKSLELDVRSRERDQ